jgi:hypothetical protein
LLLRGPVSEAKPTLALTPESRSAITHQFGSLQLS